MANIAFISHHYNLPHDTVPIGGVQYHITKVTDKLIGRDHRVDWYYHNRSQHINWNQYTHVVFHDFYSYLETPSHVHETIVYHGWEGVYPLNQDTIKRRQWVAQHCNSIINVGSFIPQHYKTPWGLVTYGAVEGKLGIHKPYSATFTYVGRLSDDNAFPKVLEFIEAVGAANVDICGDGPYRGKMIKGIHMNYHGFIDPLPHIQDNSVVIVGGYLTILDAALAARPIIGLYHHELRRDYLEMHPFFIYTSDSPQQLAKEFLSHGEWMRREHTLKNQVSATMMTWDSVADLYERAMTSHGS